MTRRSSARFVTRVHPWMQQKLSSLLLMMYDQTCQSRLRRTNIGDCRYDMFRRHGTQRPSVIRAGYVETTLEMAGMTCSEDTAHKDLRSPKIRRGEKDLQTLLSTISFIHLKLRSKKICFPFLLVHEPMLKLRMIY